AWTCRTQPSDVAPGRAHTERDERERDDCDRDGRDDLDRTGDGCPRAHTGAENPASRSGAWPGPSRYATKARARARAFEPRTIATSYRATTFAAGGSSIRPTAFATAGVTSVAYTMPASASPETTFATTPSTSCSLDTTLRSAARRSPRASAWRA